MHGRASRAVVLCRAVGWPAARWKGLLQIALSAGAPVPIGTSWLGLCTNNPTEGRLQSVFFLVCAG